MHTQIVRGLRIRDAPLLDQPYSLKLELACKLPPFHDAPPVPSKHQTWCLRNRVQATTATSKTPLRLRSNQSPCTIQQGCSENDRPGLAKKKPVECRATDS